jgi:hypothetical protein
MASNYQFTQKSEQTILRAIELARENSHVRFLLSFAGVGEEVFAHIECDVGTSVSGTYCGSVVGG